MADGANYGTLKNRVTAMTAAARRDNRFDSGREDDDGDAGGKYQGRFEASLSPRSGDQQAGWPECRVVQPGSIEAANFKQAPLNGDKKKAWSSLTAGRG
jgi:hypothetical protein